MFEKIRASISNALVPVIKGPLADTQQTISTHVSPRSTPPRVGTSQYLIAYSEMPWLRAVVNKIGISVGQTNWQLYAATDSARQRAIRVPKFSRLSYHSRKRLRKQLEQSGRMAEIEEHPLLDLIHHGNVMLTGQQNMQLTSIYLDLVGEAFWLCERDALGTPVAYWVLPPDWIREFPRPEEPYYKINFGTSIADVPITEIIPFIDPDPRNPFGRGTGIAKSLSDELEIDEYAAKHMKNFFFNRAMPNVIITCEGLRREDTARLEEAWLEKHKGFWNAWKPHFLAKKVDVKELGQTFENMQMQQLRKQERDTIIQVFGIPPEKLGIINESKRSTISAADFFWSKDVIFPRDERIRNTLQIHLVRMFDDRLILDFESPIVQDEEHRLAVMRAAPFAFDIDEWRDEAGFEPDQNGRGGDRVMPLNYVQFGTDGKLTAPLDEEGMPLVGQGGGGDSQEEPDESEDPDAPEDPDEEEEEASVIGKTLAPLLVKQIINGKTKNAKRARQLLLNHQKSQKRVKGRTIANH